MQSTTTCRRAIKQSRTAVPADALPVHQGCSHRTADLARLAVRWVAASRKPALWARFATTESAFRSASPMGSTAQTGTGVAVARAVASQAVVLRSRVALLAARKHAARSGPAFAHKPFIR